MNDLTDSQLLRAYIERHSDPAFTELVRRHIDLVHSAAMRMVCDAHLAQDVTQAVFIALAKNAAQLTSRPILSGWLHRTAQNIAAQTVRTDVRRRAREHEAAVMKELLSATPDVSWDHIAPHLDIALGQLDETDHDALLFRYFERKSAREMAVQLGISDDAAQKRVSRAVERLREFFAKRGVTVGASGFAVLLSANAVQAAPVGLALTVSTATLAGTAVTTSGLIAATTKSIAMTTLQKTLITATVVALTAATIYQVKQAKEARTEAQTVRQQQAPLAEQIKQLQSNFADATNRLAGLAQENARLKSDPNRNELLKLRGETTRLSADSKELGRTKATLSALSEQQSEALKTMRESIRHDFVKQMEQQAKTLQKKLSLTPEQTVALKNILNASIEPSTQCALEMRMGEWTEDKQNKINDWAQEQESQMMALLSPQQQAGYRQLQRERDEAIARGGANSHINDLKSELNISSEQAEAVLVALSKASMVTDESGVMHSPPPEYIGADISTEELQQRVEKRVQALTSVLTAEQLKLYRESELKKLVWTRDNLAQEKAKMQLLKSDGK